MSDNVIPQVLKLAETKYKDNSVIQALYNSFLQRRSFCNMDRSITEGYYDLDNYLKGLNGDDGYSLFLDRYTIQSLTSDPVNRMLRLKEAQTVLDCLILALQALGEAIEY